MNKKRVQILNFNCTFGDGGIPLLDRFTDYFYLAITCLEQRVYRNSTYIFNDICIYDLNGRFVLTGMLIETKKVVNHTKYDKIEEEVHDDNQKFEIQPVSYFGIFLDNHKMYYIKNQGESPSVEKFKSTVTYALRQYRKSKNAEIRKIRSAQEMWEAAEININAIPTKVLENYAELFQNAKKINYLRFKLFTKNASDWHGSFFDELLDTKSEIVSDNPVLNYPNPKNTENVGKLIAASNGYAETSLKITNEDGDIKKFVNDDFQEQTTVECLEVNDYHEKGKDLLVKLSDNPTLMEVSDFAQNEYEKHKPTLLKYYSDIITKIFKGDE